MVILRRCQAGLGAGGTGNKASRQPGRYRHYSHSPTGAPAPAKPRPFFRPPAPAKHLQRPGSVRRGLPIFTREGATQEQW